MMAQIFLIGLDHHTALVASREQVALTGDGLRLALKAMQAVDNAMFSEATILSTCNCLKVCLVAANRDDAKQSFDAFAQRFYGIEPGTLDAYLYDMSDADAIRHLMRVATGVRMCFESISVNFITVNLRSFVIWIDGQQIWQAEEKIKMFF
ncbi:MAG: hypothetical protein JXB07_20595 [Anaerolineae bacterium]|nr:hypothetical protein [Anaerolineae bacterium]